MCRYTPLHSLHIVYTRPLKFTVDGLDVRVSGHALVTISCPIKIVSDSRNAYRIPSCVYRRCIILTLDWQTCFRVPQMHDYSGITAELIADQR